MKLVDIRDKLTEALETGWTAINPTIPIFYANTMEIDLDTAPDVFLRCEIMFDDAEQVNVAIEPEQREYGTLVVTVFTREGLGTRQVLLHLGELSQMLRFKNFGGVHTKKAASGNEVTKQGWFSMDLRVPFFADSNA